MWTGHTVALIKYGLTVCDVWRRRGFNDTCFDKLLDMWDDACDLSDSAYPHLPAWWGRSDVHDSHRAMLWRKAPDLYPDFVGTFDDSIDGYVWPQ
jgi:hypothetical protein